MQSQGQQFPKTRLGRDTDGALGWVSTAGFTRTPTTSFDNAVYLPNGPRLYRIDLDGTVTQVGDYSGIGVLREILGKQRRICR